MNHLRTIMQPGTGRVAVIYDSEQFEMYLIKFFTIGQRPDPVVKGQASIAIDLALNWVKTGKLYPDEVPRGAAYANGARSAYGNWSAVS